MIGFLMLGLLVFGIIAGWVVSRLYYTWRADKDKELVDKGKRSKGRYLNFKDSDFDVSGK